MEEKDLDLKLSCPMESDNIVIIILSIFFIMLVHEWCITTIIEWELICVVQIGKSDHLSSGNIYSISRSESCSVCIGKSKLSSFKRLLYSEVSHDCQDLICKCVCTVEV